MPTNKNNLTKQKIEKNQDDFFDMDELDIENLDIEEEGEPVVITLNHEEDPTEKEVKLKSEKPEATTKKESGPIAYSAKALKDGYRFHTLTHEEQIMTRYLYTSEDSLSSFYLATQIADRIYDCPEEHFHFNFGLGMPTDGYHLAQVYDCTPSKTNPNAYVMKLLVSDTDIRCFTFTPSMLNPISAAISRDLGIRNNIFRSANSYEGIAGHIAFFKVKNVETQTGGKYSTIEEFKFINDAEYTVIEKMIDIMFNQAQ